MTDEAYHARRAAIEATYKAAEQRALGRRSRGPFKNAYDANPRLIYYTPEVLEAARVFDAAIRALEEEVYAAALAEIDADAI